MGRDKLDDSQGRGKTFPKIEVDKRFQMKKNKEGVPGFVFYDKEKKERVFYTKPLTGILIGAVNSLSSFAQTYGNKGGTYISTYFNSNNDNIVIFEPLGKKVFAGNREALNQWAAREGLEKFTSKKRMILLMEGGKVIDIETNIIIFIDQINKFEKDTFKDYFIKLTPSIFDVDTNPIGLSKKSLEFLGPFARTNKPNFALIEQGETLTDELWDAFGGDAAADMIIAWKKALTDGGVDTENHEHKADDFPTPTTDEKTEEVKETDLPETDLPEDDLPF